MCILNTHAMEVRALSFPAVCVQRHTGNYVLRSEMHSEIRKEAFQGRG